MSTVDCRMRLLSPLPPRERVRVRVDQQMVQLLIQPSPLPSPWEGEGKSLIKSRLVEHYTTAASCDVASMTRGA
jgi:hypothetical protein